MDPVKQTITYKQGQYKDRAIMDVLQSRPVFKKFTTISNWLAWGRAFRDELSIRDVTDVELDKLAEPFLLIENVKGKECVGTITETGHMFEISKKLSPHIRGRFFVKYSRWGEVYGNDRKETR
jgi:hypothetical protein